MQPDIGNKTTAPFLSGIGDIARDTSRFSDDLTLEERAQPIAEKYGDDAARIVVKLSLELGMKLDRALDLAIAGEPTFRNAVKRHLAALREKKAAELVAVAERQKRDEHAGRIRNVMEHIAGTKAAILRVRNTREFALAHAHASGQKVSDESLARLDDEAAEWTQKLEQFEAELAQLTGGAQ